MGLEAHPALPSEEAPARVCPTSFLFMTALANVKKVLEDDVQKLVTFMC